MTFVEMYKMIVGFVLYDERAFDIFVIFMFIGNLCFFLPKIYRFLVRAPRKNHKIDLEKLR